MTERGIEHPNNPDTNSAQTGNCTDAANGIGDPSALPVEMTHFRASIMGKNIHLNWATATELNNEGFEVQRSSDGRSYSKIGWVPGYGAMGEPNVWYWSRGC